MHAFLACTSDDERFVCVIDPRAFEKAMAVVPGRCTDYQSMVLDPSASSRTWKSPCHVEHQIKNDDMASFSHVISMLSCRLRQMPCRVFLTPTVGTAALVLSLYRPKRSHGAQPNLNAFGRKLGR